MELRLQVKENLVDQLDNLARELNISRDELLNKMVSLPGEEIQLMLKRPRLELKDSGPFELKTAGIIGCTAIARGLGKLLAVRGVSVIMIGESEERNERALTLMDHNMDWMIGKWELTKTEKKIIFQGSHRQVHG